MPALVAGAGLLVDVALNPSDHVNCENKGVRIYESGLKNGKGQTMKRRAEALSCYERPREEYYGAADSWHVHSIVKLFVKLQAKQVKGAIPFFQPGLLPVL